MDRFWYRLTDEEEKPSHLIPTPREQPSGTTQNPLSAYLEKENNIDVLRRISKLEDKVVKLEQRILVSSVTINSLGEKLWKLRTPMTISVEQRSPDEFIACLYDIDLYGYGETIPEAIDDLKVSIVSQLEYLLERKDKIGFTKRVEAQLNFLMEALVRRDA